MNIISLLIEEVQQEAKTTRKMLERVPVDKFDWKPHKKSMSMLNLATHIAELPEWINMAINTDGLDFEATPYKPTAITSTDDLLVLHEKSLASAISALKATNEDVLQETWVLQSGARILSSSSKLSVIRMSQSQIIHHRAQLGVYLRLLDIPIPGSYGPSADESF